MSVLGLAGGRRLIAPVAAAAAVLQLWSAAAWSFDLGVTKTAEPAMTSEFVYRNDTEEALIPIYLLGAVSKPGLYHIPANMDLIGLLTLAGGATAGAQTDRILIRSQGAQGRETRFDLEEAIQGERPVKLALSSNDLVYVTPGKPPIMAEVLTVMGIVTGILGIITTSIVISQNLHK